ncbi:MAG: hypothetical protein CMJ64_02995 [Planctomycetaceae bacterium]|nr:hypothetical protein [Planctomycetaceae bacterium]
MNADIGAGVAGVVLLAVSAAWIVVLGRLGSGDSILAFEPRRRAPWGIGAVILSFLLLVVGQAAAPNMFGPQGDEAPSVNQTIDLLAALGIATLAVTVVSALAIGVAHGAKSHDLGLSLKHIGRDIVIGVVAFLILGPLAFAIQAFFVYQLGIESHHPLIELVKADPTNELFTMVTAVAVLVAPMSEEYFFRVLFQGWIEKHFLFGDPWQGSSDVGESDKVANAWSADPNESGEQRSPYHNFVPLSEATDERPADEETEEPSGGFAPTFVPILCSATLFAAMHWSHGPDAVALFVLAVGLGYLYQRTHRWLPCVVTHLCLNGTTMVMLWTGMQQLAK